MKKIVLISIALFLLSTGCKKIIKKTQEQIAEDLIVNAMTNGQWIVIGYNDAVRQSSGFYQRKRGGHGFCLWERSL